MTASGRWALANALAYTHCAEQTICFTFVHYPPHLAARLRLLAAGAAPGGNKHGVISAWKRMVRIMERISRGYL